MFHRITLIGNLGGDPEMRYTASGVPVTNFSVATTRRWTTPDGESREKTTWFRVTAWRRLAEVCNEYLAKGRQVFVEGEIDSHAWAGNDGEPRSSLDVTASTVKFLGSRGDQGGGGGGGSYGPPAPEDPYADSPSKDDEIPF
jgi:single-strand DNA-binding protein